MWRKILLLVIIFCLIFNTLAFAVETAGEVVFRDAIYGAAIGGILAGAAYLIDQDHFAKKLGTGVAIGTIAGVLYGIYENTAIAEIENGKVKFAFPTPQISPTLDAAVAYSASIVRVKF